MEENINYVEEVRNLILKNKKPSYQTTNRKEIRVRCPYCGDSKKDSSSAHLYIEMKPPFKFHCFKCETAGVLTQQTLRDFGIFDNNLSVDIIEANKSLKDIGVQKISFKKIRNLKNIQNLESEHAKRALEYFNKRFDINFSAEYIKNKFKVILDAETFFKANNIFVPVGQYDFSNAIGFISADESHIVFRDISGKQPKRYYNLSLIQDDFSIANKMYNIFSSIDLLSEEVTLVITEGILDIIGVYTHFYKDTEEEKNTIFAAACGKGYNAVIAHYIRMGFLNLKVIIYSDGDVEKKFYENLKKSSNYIKNSRLTIYYNSLYDPKTGFGKDYGVPKNQIQLSRSII